MHWNVAGILGDTVLAAALERRRQVVGRRGVDRHGTTTGCMMYLTRLHYPNDHHDRAELHNDSHDEHLLDYLSGAGIVQRHAAAACRSARAGSAGTTHRHHHAGPPAGGIAW